MTWRLEAAPYHVPMAAPFSHASFRRDAATGVLIRATGPESHSGWGEAAPRPYVTGETVETVIADIGRIPLGPLSKHLDRGNVVESIGAIRGLRGFLAEQGAEVGPSSLCGIELALLDSLLRRGGMTFSDLLRDLLDVARGPGEETEYSFTTVIGLDGADQAVDRLSRGERPPRGVKIKANADLAAAARLLSRLRGILPPEVPVGMDVNGGWSVEQLFAAGEMLGPLGIAWIEEPIAARRWRELAAFRQRYGIPVMLDESCCSPADLADAVAGAAVDIVNVRLSKCGGVFASAEMINSACREGLRVYLGVHVGEVGPLWATQRHFAATVADPAGIEAGRQDEWFPVPTTEPPYAIDRCRFRARPLAGFGHGSRPSRALWFSEEIAAS